MEFKLCYKTYSFKMNLAAMKQFKERTGLDLWFTLVAFLECYVENQHKPTLTLMRALFQKLDFETASEVLYCLIQQAEKSIEIEQLQDAMFRVGWRPVDAEDSEFRQPWPLVMVDIANQIDRQLQQAIDVKKKAPAG